MKKNLKQSIFAIVAALIWGLAFVAQSSCANIIDVFTFNFIRDIIAAILLFIVILVLKIYHKKKKTEEVPINYKKLIIGGVCCGILLFTASCLQQYGIKETQAGKAGFLTSLYIVIVPILGLIFKKRVGINVWISVLISLFGLYFLCIDSEFNISLYDSMIILCAFIFSAHILSIDYFSKGINSIYLSFVQFVVGSIIAGILMLIFEKPNINIIIECIIPLLYVGIMSSGVAYTLQILAQKDSNPTVISLLLSLESVFSVIGGLIILGDNLSLKEYIGCIFMLIAVVLAQIPIKYKRKKQQI